MTNIVNFPVKKGWQATVCEIIVVMPINDLEEHDPNSVWCKCKPHFKWEDGPILIHYALDGRE